MNKPNQNVTTSPRKRGRPTKKTNSEKNTVNGKIYSSEFQDISEWQPKVLPTKFKNIYEMLGNTDSCPYDTLQESEYEHSLRQMPKLDLQEECTKRLIHPKDDREAMIQNLLKEFRTYLGCLSTASVSAKVLPNNKNVHDILSKAR